MKTDLISMLTHKNYLMEWVGFCHSGNTPFHCLVTNHRHIRQRQLCLVPAVVVVGGRERPWRGVAARDIEPL